MKGIILAGGAGTRLMPMTKIISKQILPLYDKPMIYYPLSVLMQVGIKDILIISTPRDVPYIRDLLGDGRELGISITYAEQAKPEGIAQAFLIGETFIDGQPVCLILGDNIFYGRDLSNYLQKAAQQVQSEQGACVFAYHVRDPERYGVVDFDAEKRVRGIEEKPKHPKTNWAVTGLYCYDGRVVEMTKRLKPSARGELEITDLNVLYLEDRSLRVEFFGRGMAWLDAGTPESLLTSAQFIQTVEERQGLKIGCIEEIAYHHGFITRDQLLGLAERLGKNSYAEYLRSIADEEIGGDW